MKRVSTQDIQHDQHSKNLSKAMKLAHTDELPYSQAKDLASDNDQIVNCPPICTHELENVKHGNVVELESEFVSPVNAQDLTANEITCVLPASTSASSVDNVNIEKESAVQDKSNEDLRKELFSILSLFTENCGDFATGGLLADNELQCYPNIEIDDYGILPLPLNKITFESIKHLCSRSPYGLGEQTLIDATVRNSFQLEPDAFLVKNTKFMNQVSVLIEDKIKPSLGLKGANIYGKVYKLLFYEPGGKFDEHRDTEKDDDMFGTLIIQLPSVFTGGDLIVKHCNSVQVFNNSSPESSTHCSFVAHYASCPHELKEVTSGYRVALIYSLCWQGNGLMPSPYHASTNTVKLCNSLNEFMEKADEDIIQWALEYEYSSSSIHPGTLDFFKGCDKNIIFGLNNALRYDKMKFGKDRWEFYIATAEKKVTQYGNCNGHGGYGYRCGNDDCCFDYDWEESNEPIKLSDFISLTSKIDKNNLEFEFDPEGALNWNEDEEFWGDGKGTGCSGPTGNAGASREQWYQRKVVVLWRCDKSLSIKIDSNLSDGVSHVLSLLKNGELIEGKRGFELLWKYLERISFDSTDVIKLLEMSTILNCTKESFHLIETMHEWGIPTGHSALVIAHAACRFKDKKQIVVVTKELIKKSYKSQIKHVLQCCSNINWLDPTMIVQLVIDFTLKHTSGSLYTASKVPIFAYVLEFMFKHNTFPSGSMENLASMIDSLAEMDSAVKFLAKFKGNHDHLRFDLFISQFMSIASVAVTKEGNYEVKSYEQMINAILNTFLTNFMEKGPLNKFLSLLVSSIKVLPRNSQCLLKILVNQIHLVLPDKENLSDCLLDACRIRFQYLEGIVRRGKPGMSWVQPNAVVPAHPRVQQFLRGPERSFTYRNFNDLKHARNWANKHRRDSGCFMELTPIGRGSSAAVEIVKTSEGYNGILAVYKRNVEEYKRLLNMFQGTRNVLNQQGESTGRVNPNTADVIVLD